MPNVNHDPSTDQVAVTHKQWALDHLAYAAAEYRRHGYALEHFTEKAFDYGCTPDEVAQILAARQ